AGHWWHALGDSLVFQLMVLLPGPLAGLILMLGGRASVNFANTLSSVVYAVSLPIAFIGLTFAYRRYESRSGEVPVRSNPLLERLQP
ncbi:MAG: hypothetical protein IT336_17230, partial [Thermomicrobiales bacterium]|nr:hypothetical protein [Thermomicrobiales bacterium]